MSLESMTKIAVSALYASVIAILFGLIAGMLGKLLVMMICMGLGSVAVFIFELISERIDEWYETHSDEKY